jgi:hypothetical protein
MVRRAMSEQPQPANVAQEHMKRAIPILKRLIAELEEIDVNTIQKRGELRFHSLEKKIDSNLVDIFGNNTIEYLRFSINGLDATGVYLMREAPLHEVMEGYRRGIQQAVSNLKTIVKLFEKKIRDLGESPDERALKAVGALDIYPEIAHVITKLFRDGRLILP